MTESDGDDELLRQLGIDTEAEPAGARTPREERVIAGFEDILRFHAAHGRAPAHGEDRDIFERLYAVRLDRLRALPDACVLLAPLDAPGLLGRQHALPVVDAMDDEALFAELGVDADGGPVDAGNDIRVLRHVRSGAERSAPDEVAERARCADFDTFRPVFAQIARELEHGVRTAQRFASDGSIGTGDVFILGGQTAYVAGVGQSFRTPNGVTDARLRVVFDNGTESNLLMRSLQRALYKDESGRSVSAPGQGPLFGTPAAVDAPSVFDAPAVVDAPAFAGAPPVAGPRTSAHAAPVSFGDAAGPDDVASGTVYVLRSRSDDPYVQAHRELIHKIGVTGGRVEARLSGAAHDATYLLADVDLVATYALHNVRCSGVEALLHRLFADVQLDLTIHDRFGRPVRPAEWFLVPLAVIDEAVRRVQDGTITAFVYDRHQARLVAA